MPLQPPSPESDRKAPNWAVYALLVCGLGGTGVGYVRTQSAEQQASVSQREADKAIVARNRFEDQMNHCLERQIDFLRDPAHVR